MAKKFLDSDGLRTLWEHIKEIDNSIATNSKIGHIKSSLYHSVAAKGITPSTDAISIAVNNRTNTAGRFYSIETDSNGFAFVNVPWTDTNTNYYPTSFSWTNGTTSGPTGSLKVSGTNAVSFAAIPSAAINRSGIVTTGAQTFSGDKTFNNSIIFASNSTPKISFLDSTGARGLSLYSDPSSSKLYINNEDSEQIFSLGILGDANFAKSVTASKFITSGGTSSQLVAGDGSLISKSSITSNYLPLSGGTLTGTLTGTTIAANTLKGVNNAQLVLAADGTNTKGFVVDNTSSFRPTTQNTTSSLGSSTNKWKNAYIETVHGSLDGNATTATTAAGLSSKPSLSASGNNIKVTAGGQTSAEFTVPYATSASELSSPRTISLGTAVTSTATSFDGTANITIPVTGIKEAYVKWGGRNIANDFMPIDAAMIQQLGANRFDYLNPDGITIEYSRDGGSSWINYTDSDVEKQNLFSPVGADFRVGKPQSGTIPTNKYQLRVIVDTELGEVYTQIKKFAILISSYGSSGNTVTIEKALASTPTVFTPVVTDVSISGWSGWNIINDFTSFTTYGNSETAHYKKIKFTFKITSHSSSYPGYGLTILKIQAFGGMGWTAPSELAKTGHIYKCLSNQAVEFPGDIRPVSTNTTLSLGSSTNKWKNAYIKTVHGSLDGNASTATKLQTARSIDGVNFNGTAAITHYGTCSTAAATTAKVVALTGFTKSVGSEVTIKFTVTNSASNPTLNVNGTGAAPIYYNGAAISPSYLKANKIYRFVFDGTNWNLVGDVDTNTTYTLSSFGITATASELNYMDGVTSKVQTQLNSKAPLVSPALTGTPTAPTATSGTNNTQIATTAFVQAAINSSVAGLKGQLIYKGTVNSNSNLPASHTQGWTYVVGTAGTYAGEACEVGDMIICVTTGTAANNAHWNIIQTNINGAVTGPASSVDSQVALFSGSTGKILKAVNASSLSVGSATSATKLSTARTIDGVSFNGTAAITHYGTCSTAAATAAKVVSITGFTLVTGARATIKFTVTNSASNPTLNVNGTGAKYIKYKGTNISPNILDSNSVYEFVYDGTAYQLIGNIALVESITNSEIDDIFV